MLDHLLLLSGNDIPFPSARVTIHQPTLKQIAYISENTFWTGCQLLRFDKDMLITEDKKGLSSFSNFNILMSIINEKNMDAQQAKIKIFSILALLFPTKKFLLDDIKALKLEDVETGEISEINESNFEDFQKILIQMFCLSNSQNKQYNPSGDLAKKIADKLKKGHEKRAELAPETEMSIFNRYVSILAVGENKDVNSLMNYTVYQILDEFNRFISKMHYDSWVQYKIAGAEGLEEPENWLDDIHNKNSKNN